MIIYRIFNKKTNKSYVGQTIHKKFNLRYSGGRWWGITDNPLLIAAYKKHGIGAFDKEILESNVGSIEKLNELEEFYANKFNCYCPNGYNLRKCGDNRRLLEHQIELIRKNKSKHYEFRKIDTWEIVKVFNLREFCRKNGLTHSAMYNMARKTPGIISSQGYCLSSRSKEEVESRDCRKFKNVAIEIIHESGTRAKVTNVKNFAKDHNMEKGSLYKLLNGEMLYYFGWRLPSRIGEPKASEAKFELISPEGERIVGVGVKKFCEERSLRYGGIGRVLRGELVDYRGWTLPSTTKEEVFMKKRKLAISIDLVDPNGVVLNIKNLRFFCHERQMDYDLFYNLYKGYVKSALGWRKLGTVQKKYNFIDPDGKKYETLNLNEFCKKHGLHCGCIRNIMAGNGNSHRGWTATRELSVL